MLFISLFLAGFTLGVLTVMFVFAPEKEEEAWDLQNFPPKIQSLRSETKNSARFLGDFKSQKNGKPKIAITQVNL